MRKLELAEAPRGSSEKRDEEVVAVLVEQRVPSRVLGKSIIRTALPLAILAAAAPALAQADQLSTNTFGGASASLTAGIQLLREGKWQEAAAEAEKAEAAAVTPQQKAEALLLRAHALTLGGNVAEAARVYQRAALLDGVSPSQRLEAWQGAERAAAAAGLTGLQRQAVEALLSAPQLSPSERARLLTQLGEAFLRDGDEERAAQAFVEVTTRYPDEYAAALCRRHLVSILARRQQIEPLLQTLAEARRQNRPEAEQLHLQAAQILQQYDRLDEAIRVLTDVLSWHPSSQTVWAAAWDVYARAGRGKELVERAIRAAQADRDVSRAVVGLADSMGLSQDIDTRRSALRLYETVLALSGDDVTILSGAARLALKLGELDRAEAWSARALSSQPDDRVAQEVRAAVLVRLGRGAEALELLKKAARFRPEDIQSARTLAGLLQQTGLGEHLPQVVSQVRAATGIQAALAADLARFYAEQGQWVQAVTELLCALGSGEASDAYAQAMLRAWVADISARDAVLEALGCHWAKRPLSPEATAVYLHGLLCAGRGQQAAALLRDLPDPDRRQVASSLIAWGAPADGEVRAELYKAALGQQTDPVSEAQLAAALASELISAGRWNEALEVLRKHHKPGLPSVVARGYDLLMAEGLAKIGQPDEAERVAGPWATAGDPWATVIVAEAALQQGRYEEASRQAGCISGRVRQNEPPSDLQGYAVRLARATTDQAEEWLARAALVEAQANLLRGRIDEAEKKLRRLIESAPQTAAATRAVGMLLLVVQLRSVEDTERQRALAALQAITGGDIEVAEDQIRALAETDAASELIANLRLLSAEAEAPRRPRSAAQKLEALAQASPNCSAAPYALYLAATYLEADEPAQALRLAEGLLRDYPDTALGPLVTRLMERARQRTNSSTEKG